MSLKESYCISLSESELCPLYNTHYVSTSSLLISDYPFLTDVSNIKSFDHLFKEYITNNYIPNLTELNLFSPLYITTILCHDIIQKSSPDCNANIIIPGICPDTCSDWSASLYNLLSRSECQIHGASISEDRIEILRNDFIECANNVPSISCISGYENEFRTCGYGSNTLGLCNFCVSKSSEPCCSSLDKLVCASYFPNSSVFASIEAVNINTPPPNNSQEKQNINNTIEILIIFLSLFSLCMALYGIYGINRCLSNRKKKLHKPTLPNNKKYEKKSSIHENSLKDKQVSKKSNLLKSTKEKFLNLFHRPEKSNSLANNNISKSLTLSLGPTFQSLIKISKIKIEQCKDISSRLFTFSSEYPKSEIAAAYFDKVTMTFLESGKYVGVLYPYAAQKKDEYTLYPGNVLRIVTIYNDGWADGELMPDYTFEHRSESLYKTIEQKIPIPSPLIIKNENKSNVYDKTKRKRAMFPLVCICSLSEYTESPDKLSITDSKGQLKKSKSYNTSQSSIYNALDSEIICIDEQDAYIAKSNKKSSLGELTSMYLYMQGQHELKKKMAKNQNSNISDIKSSACNKKTEEKINSHINNHNDESNDSDAYISGNITKKDSLFV